MLELLPETAQISGGELAIGGVPAARLAERHGTPLLVYCGRTIRSQVRSYHGAAPGALIVYGTKAFANLALLQLLAEEGVGADVSTLGELAFARDARISGGRIVFHGNNKSSDRTRTSGRECPRARRRARISRTPRLDAARARPQGNRGRAVRSRGRLTSLPPTANALEQPVQDHAPSLLLPASLSMRCA